MSEAFQKHIYESFSRAENSVTNKVQGTGLGMAITKNIVDMMGGVITLQSQLGKGTRFEVVLDFKICEETVQAAPAVCPAPAQDSPSLHGMRFLCAEDNEINAEILQSLLEMRGASCTICRDGVEVVEKFRTVAPGEYDAILMDVQMPLMDGGEAARQIRALPDPALAKIPILAMTANAFEEDRKSALECGMNGFLSKPINIEELIAALSSLLAG